MQIKAVETKKDLKRFISFPRQVYRGDPCWVSPLLSEVEFVLNPKKNPFWEHAQQRLFLAARDGKIIGRIAGIIDRTHIDLHHEPVGFFGFFEALNDYEIAEMLLSRVREWLREKGMKAMRGPICPSTNEECGILIAGFDSPPFIMMYHNPPYYPKFMDRFGLKKAIDWQAYLAPVPAEPPKEVITAAKFAHLKCPQARIRQINMKEFDEEAQKIREVYNSAWNKNWGFVPFTPAEMQSLANRLKPLAIPELTLFAEIEGKTVGILVCIPNFNLVLKHLNGRLFPFGFLKALYYGRKIDSFRLIIMGVKEEYRKMGLEALLYLEGLKAAHKLGYKWYESSLILEDNIATRKAAEAWGGKVHKTYRIYEMKI